MPAAGTAALVDNVEVLERHKRREAPHRRIDEDTREVARLGRIERASARHRDIDVIVVQDMNANAIEDEVVADKLKRLLIGILGTHKLTGVDVRRSAEPSGHNALKIDTDHADERHIAGAALLLSLDALGLEERLGKIINVIFIARRRTKLRVDIERRVSTLLQPIKCSAHNRLLGCAVRRKLLSRESCDFNREKEVLSVLNLLLSSRHTLLVVVTGHSLTVTGNAIALRAEDLHDVRENKVPIAVIDRAANKVRTFGDRSVISLRERRDLNLLLPIERLLALQAADDRLKLKILAL